MHKQNQINCVNPECKKPLPDNKPFAPEMGYYCKACVTESRAFMQFAMGLIGKHFNTWKADITKLVNINVIDLMWLSYKFGKKKGKNK